MDKMLMITHMGQMIAQFNESNINILLDLGVEVHVAANFDSPHNTMSKNKLLQFVHKFENKGVFFHQVDFDRGIGTLKSNLKVWNQLNQICQTYDFSFIHCQSPLGGVFGRLIGRKYKKKVIYTAHGFHFFKGSPLKNWIVFYPIEKILSRFTDELIVINSEDFNIAKRFSKSMNVTKIPGVGIKWESINKRAANVNRNEIREKLGIPHDAFVLISAGELSTRKNQMVIIKALEKLHDKNIFYLICGIGEKKQELQDYLDDNDLNQNVRLLGYREDVPELYGISDVCVFPSKREGLGLAGIEAMATGLPIITSNINGIMEYAIDGKTGYTCDPDDSEQFKNAIMKIKIQNRSRYKKYNLCVSRKFDRKIVDQIMNDIYLKMKE